MCEASITSVLHWGRMPGIFRILSVTIFLLKRWTWDGKFQTDARPTRGYGRRSAPAQQRTTGLLFIWDSSTLFILLQGKIFDSSPVHSANLIIVWLKPLFGWTEKSAVFVHVLNEMIPEPSKQRKIRTFTAVAATRWCPTWRQCWWRESVRCRECECFPTLIIFLQHLCRNYQLQATSLCNKRISETQANSFLKISEMIVYSLPWIAHCSG